MAKKTESAPPLPSTKMRRFLLHRLADPSGVSGTGYVAEGVEWTDGRVDLRWLTAHKTESTFPNIKTLVTLHGHEGQTQLVWIDPDPTEVKA